MRILDKAEPKNRFIAAGLTRDDNRADVYIHKVTSGLDRSCMYIPIM